MPGRPRKLSSWSRWIPRSSRFERYLIGKPVIDAGALSLRRYVGEARLELGHIYVGGGDHHGASDHFDVDLVIDIE